MFRISIVLIILIAGCNLSSSTRNQKVDQTAIAANEIRPEKSNPHFDTTGFLSNCVHLMNRNYLGALQGTKASKDSIFNLCFAVCYDCPETYKVIFVYKTGVKERSLMNYKTIGDSFDKGCTNDFKEFDCFAFKLPLKEPEEQEDMHTLNMDFPVTVKAYKRVEMDKWKLETVKKVATFEEYGQLQFDVIYGLNKK